MKPAAILLVLLNAALLVPALAASVKFIAIAAVLLSIVVLVLAFSPRPATAPAVAEAKMPAAAAAPENQARAEIVTLLGLFQEKGRLVDFLMEDITPFSDAQVGVVARTVHQGCKEVLADHFQIEPVSPVGEGATFTVPAGYAADEYRLTGKLSGDAPFSGKIVHKGWKTSMVKLPRVMKTDRLPAIAPAQVEVQ